MDVVTTLRRLGRLVPTYAMLRRGITSHQLTAAVRSGTIVRVRQGWYALPDERDELLRAARVGGRLACSSAAAHHGLAVRGDRLHVEVSEHASRLRDPHDYRRRVSSETVVHWQGRSAAGGAMATSVVESLRQMALCASPERTIAAVDSALRRGQLSPDEWARSVASLPRRLRRLLSRVDAKSESITESVVRFRLAMLGVETRTQVSIRGVGAVDLLVGTALVIELDGKKYHTDEGRFEKDRRRDARLSAQGYRVLRFSYRQVFERWSEVRAAIMAAIARGDSAL